MVGDKGLESRTIPPAEYTPNHDEHFVVMSYEQFKKHYKKFKNWKNDYENIIVDEAHAFKTAEGDRNRALFEISSTFDKVWGLSGTPMDNEETDKYNLYNAITGVHHDLGSKTEF